tara:strand:- start:330 stop:524 length:195 start_codon:yes stop_codon:yes gene_type:complete
MAMVSQIRQHAAQYELDADAIIDGISRIDEANSWASLMSELGEESTSSTDADTATTPDSLSAQA